ncbi:rRNA-processing protein [Malassezia furfur]|uniref:rRNA-processing protein n=1 Tax=Malassezia furfur TaxID=55194 RepID=A0ABY8ETQ5_MALFU|nr:PWP1 [Malassezia furfur]WFD48988.1 rRNA-processing protein [Malassezia furfur]
MISSAAWVSRGLAARHPKKQELDEAELARVSRLANRELNDANLQLSAAQQASGDGWEDVDDSDEAMEEEDTNNDPDDLSRYRLDSYDEEPSQSIALGALSNIRGLSAYRTNDDDPYVSLQDDAVDEEEEREQLEVLPTDNLVYVSKTEDDISMIEAYLYSAQDQNLYVHHDLLLPAFPLHLEWLDYAPAPVTDGADGTPRRAAGTMGNFVAVGTMDPEIEIWDMDTIEGVYPDAVLGRKDATSALEGPAGTGKKKRKQPKARVPNAAYHVDAVLSLSWNRQVRNLLASASADTTVKIWDLSRPASGADATALRSFQVHTDKVQSVAWQVSGAGVSSGAANPAVLLTGSYDKTIRVFDTRMPEQALVAGIGADVEAVRWNGWKNESFVVAMENGVVQGFDARQLSSTLTSDAAQFTLVAHDAACTTLDISPHIPGCLLTGGTDRQVKLWSVEDEGAAKPRSINLVAARDLDVGKVFTASFSPNDPLTVAVGGSNGKLQIWDTLSNPGMRRTFGDRLRRMDQYADRHAAPVSVPRLDEEDGEGARPDVVQVEDDAESDENME